jgi:hypothetical protein
VFGARLNLVIVILSALIPSLNLIIKGRKASGVLLYSTPTVLEAR